MINSQRNKIAPISIFFMLYISRVVVTLTNMQSVSSGMINTDMLISIVLALGLNLLLCLPAIWCYKNNKSPFEVKGVNLFYALYFIYLAGVNISRFSYFASTVLNPEASAWVFSLIIAVCAGYASRFGIEGLSRFSAFGFILIVLTVVAGTMFNFKNYDEINLYPVIRNSTREIAENVFYITSSSVEVIVLLCLGKRVNGSAVKPFVFSVIASFLTTFILILFINATMGDAANLQAFPVYTMFQLAKIGLFERLDVLQISFWIFGIFIKSVLLIYCSSVSIKSYKNSTKCIIASVLSLAVAFVLTEFTDTSTITPTVYVAPYFVACVLIPLLTLIFKKKNSGDELIEKF